jgi:hypothetical protein
MPYILQETPDESCVYRSTGAKVKPIVTLKDEHGGVSHIIEDDHCYVLLNGSEEKGFAPTPYWYPEAVEVLRGMPPLDAA